MRLLMLHSEHTAVGYFRILLPAQRLARLGHEVVCFPDAPPHESLKSKSIDPAKWYDDHSQDFDLVIAARTSMFSSTEFLAKMRKYNDRPLVMDFDDHFTDVPPYNAAYALHHPSGYARKASLLQVKISDAVTVSTDALRDNYLAYNKDITVLPNLVDEERWRNLRVDPERVNDKALRLVFAGNSGRYGDAEVIRKPLTALMNEYPYLKLYFLIMFPDWAVKWNMSGRNPKENRAYFLNYTPFIH